MVWVTLKEIEAISRYLQIELEEFGKNYLRLVDNRLSLIEMPNYDCVFLKQGACEIYPVRPAQCRSFPFWREMLSSRERWENNTAFCPGAGQGKTYTQQEIERIANGSET